MSVDYKWARENFNLYKAEEEASAIPYNINRNGDYYRHLLRSIERKWDVEL